MEILHDGEAITTLLSVLLNFGIHWKSLLPQLSAVTKTKILFRKCNTTPFALTNWHHPIGISWKKSCLSYSLSGSGSSFYRPRCTSVSFTIFFLQWMNCLVNLKSLVIMIYNISEPVLIQLGVYWISILLIYLFNFYVLIILSYPDMNDSLNMSRYYTLTDLVPAYFVAIALNPEMKYKYFENEWEDRAD